MQQCHAKNMLKNKEQHFDFTNEHVIRAPRLAGDKNPRQAKTVMKKVDMWSEQFVTLHSKSSYMSMTRSEIGRAHV